MKKPALQNKQFVVLRMAFRARKGFGTFEKRAPGHETADWFFLCFFFSCFVFFAYHVAMIRTIERIFSLNEERALQLCLALLGSQIYQRG